MRHRRWPLLELIIAPLIILALVPATARAEPDAPPGFVVENAFPDVNFSRPVDIAFFPDGRALVAQKNGIVWTVLADGTRNPLPFIGLAREVLNLNDRGLLGIAIDPDVQSNGWVYFLYTTDPDADGTDDEEDTWCALVRYQVDAADPNRADVSSEQFLIGETWSTGIPTLHTSHTIGSLRFAADGTLLVSVGDGARWEDVDAGGSDPAGFLPGRTDPGEDLGAFRSRSIHSLAGGILRLDPGTGAGLESNPFWDGDPFSDASRIWAYGLRNPFRFCVRPGTGSADPTDGDPGTLYVGDVGWYLWEEVVIIDAGGYNGGWPCEEGPQVNPPYQAVAATAAGNLHVLCDEPGDPDNPDNPRTSSPPGLWWHHNNPDLSHPVGWRGFSVTGGVFYTGASWPSAYHGAYLAADFVQDWIRVVTLDDNDVAVTWDGFIGGAGGAVDFEPHPDTGDIYYIAYFDEEVRRIGYSAPVAVDEPATGPARLQLHSAIPNPFRTHATIRFTMPTDGAVRVTIVNASGREVRGLLDATLGAGRQVVDWDGKDGDGRDTAPGVYFFRVDTPAGSASGRLTRSE